MRVSIVVPIYNVEEYLKECIESILKQTLPEIEIILVDDGSTDGSSVICDNYANKYNNVIVIHQNNGGLTVARRNGVNAASGEYVGFVDGDDWIDNDMYECLYKIATDEKVDIVTAGGIREYQRRGYQSRLGDTVGVGKYEANDKLFLQKIFSCSIGDEYINGAVWSKLFRVDIIRDVLNSIPDNVNGCMDDNVCVVGSILQSQTVYVSSIYKYHHRERGDAYSHKMNKRVFEQINHAYDALDYLISKSRYRDIVYPKMVEHVAMKLIDGLTYAFDNKVDLVPKYYVSLDDAVEIGAKIIIYGYGDVGKSVYRQLIREGKYKVVGVSDKNIKTNKDGIGIIEPRSLNQFDADVILVAVSSNKLAEDIKRYLNGLGVTHKIIWRKPCSLIEYYR